MTVDQNGFIRVSDYKEMKVKTRTGHYIGVETRGVQHLVRESRFHVVRAGPALDFLELGCEHLALQRVTKRTRTVAATHSHAKLIPRH